MGRAINMQKDIDDIKMELERLNNIVRGMASELSDVTSAVFEEEIEETEDVKEADNQGDGKGDESDDSADRSADTKGK